MPEPSSLRDSTQILLPSDALDGVRDDLQEEFTLTIVESDDTARLIGSPVEIKAANEFLARRGFSLQ